MLAAVRIRPFGFFVSVTAITVIAVLMGSVSVWPATAAVDSNESTFVPVTPVRILDTRDPIDVGLAGPFVSPIAQKLRVTGAVSTTDGTQTVIPVGATGVVLNVTVALPTAAGFVSVRPGDATGAPATSSLNFDAGVVQPNAVTVELPTSGPNAGTIDITYDAYGTVGPVTDVIMDVVGFTTNAGIQSLVADLAAKADRADVYTKSEADAALATKADIDRVRAAMLADKTWSAWVSENGTKLSSGPYTSDRLDPGFYRVTFNVADLGIRDLGTYPIPVATARCIAHVPMIWGFGWTTGPGGVLTSFFVLYRVTDQSNVPADCEAFVHVKFADLDTGSPIGPLSTEKAAATPPSTPEGAICTADEDTTTCTVDSVEPVARG
jgi:hypothetical protein